MSSIVWFTRDLRVHDHPALRAALDSGGGVIPVFCFDERLLRGRHRSGSRTQFLLECLTELDRSLRKRGSGLVIREGLPERELPALAAEAGAKEVHLSTDVSPFAQRRLKGVRKALQAAGVKAQGHPGLNVVDDLGALRTKAGDPYRVFSPFHRSWGTEPRREVLGAPRRLAPLPRGIRKGRIPSLASLRLAQEVEAPPRGGEARGRDRLRRFLADGVIGYASGQDDLAGNGTSRLSPYLHFGCVSVREVEDRLPRGSGAAAYRRQLCWRDFHHHVLLHFPRNARSELRREYRGRIRWSYAKRPFEAWCDGHTGFPLVDAAMRQLRLEGWIPNRARLVVGSFLTKDLGIDWRWGERHFMRLLVDGDEANNNGNWQWIASVGTDPQPVFRRLYNPARHQERYDPQGEYVRRYVPELRDVPDEFLSEPSKMPEDVQRRSGCLIGRDYPRPIVDHAIAREEALERYRSAKRKR